MSAGNSEPIDIGDEGGAEGSGDSGDGGYLSGFSAIRDWFGSGFSKKDAGILALLAGGLANAGGEDFSVDSVIALGNEVGATESPGANSLVGVLVGFAQSPIEFIWKAVLQKLILFIIELVLWMADTVLGGIRVILFGSSIGFQSFDSGGRVGITDLGFVVLDPLLDVLVGVVSAYFDVLVWIVEWTDPGSGTIWDGVIRTIATFAVAAATVWLLYRLSIALSDAIPGISGVQTFITGGS